MPPATAGPSRPASLQSSPQPTAASRAASASSRSSCHSPKTGSSGASQPASAPRDRLREELQLGIDREPHAPTSASTASVSAPSAGAGRASGRDRRRRRGRRAPSIVTGPRPGWSTSWSRPFARTWASACTVSRASTGPAGTPAAPRRASHASTGARRDRIARSRAVTRCFSREHAGVVAERGRAPRSSDRRDRRAPRNALRCAEVEAGDGKEAVGRLVAAVVRVHRRGRPRSRRPAPSRSARVAAAARADGLALEPDEILDLHGERGTEQRDLDQLPLPTVRAAHERREHAGGEQVPGREVGHRDAAGPHRHPVTVRGMRGEQARAALRDEVVGRLPGERPVRPERGHDADDERRVRRVQPLPVEPERRRARRRRVVDDDVGCRRRAWPSAARPGSDLRSSTTERLPRLSGTKKRPTPARDRHHLPVGVATRRLDLDHLGAELGEQRPGERPGHVLRHLDHAHALERQAHRRPSPRRAITSCCTSAVPPAIVEPTDAR